MSKPSARKIHRAGALVVAVVTMLVPLSAGEIATSGATADAQTSSFSGALDPNGWYDVVQGGTDQPAVYLAFVPFGSAEAGASMTFSLPRPDCSTSEGIARAISFSSPPEYHFVTAHDAGPVPTTTSALGSSTAARAAAGVRDTFTIVLTATNGVSSVDVKLYQIRYDVGSHAQGGPVAVTATTNGFRVPGSESPEPGGPSHSATNAMVRSTHLSVDPRVGTPSGRSRVRLGAVSYREQQAGYYFRPGPNIVRIQLTGWDPGVPALGRFSPGVTPQITVPNAYHVGAAPSSSGGGCDDGDGPPVTTRSHTYTFCVTAPADIRPATVVVSGLRVDVASEADVGTLNVTSMVKSTGRKDVAAALNSADELRLGGHDRFATAATVFAALQSDEACLNEDTFECDPVSHRDVVLSNGLSFPDALSGDYLAGEQRTGILLTRSGRLPQPTRHQIVSQHVERVFVTGGSHAISRKVVHQISSLRVGGNPANPHLKVVRIDGKDRYAINRAINAYQRKPRHTVLLASGKEPYDALAAGPVTYHAHDPLVLTDGTDLSHGEEKQLADFDAKHVVIIGGTSVVSPAIQERLTGAGYDVHRVAGANRYQTAARVAAWATFGPDADRDGQVSDADGFIGSALPVLLGDLSYVASGRGYADALAAGPLAGAGGGALLLTRGSRRLDDSVSAYLDTKHLQYSCDGAAIYAAGAVGGTRVVPERTMASIIAAVGDDGIGIGFGNGTVCYETA